jgi:hypothetical protein
MAPLVGVALVSSAQLLPIPVFKMIKNPFASHEDPLAHMVALLSKEAESAGTPFSEDDKKILASESRAEESVPEELRQKAKKLIEELLRKEQSSGAVTDPKSFDNSLEWAGQPGYPNIVALTEEVVASGGSLKTLPKLHGKRWANDRFQLLGCGLSIVLLMFLIVGILTVVFHRK